MEFTFGYKRDATGKPRIFVHHSSMPYDFHTGGKWAWVHRVQHVVL